MQCRTLCQATWLEIITPMVTGFPFTESYGMRTFSADVSPDALVWHWDEQYRIVKSVDVTDWMIQLDNKLPESLNDDVHIPAGMFHRLIKGSSDLNIIVNKI